MMEYFKAIGTMILGNLGKAIVLRAMVKYTCFPLFYFSNSSWIKEGIFFKIIWIPKLNYNLCPRVD